MPKWLAPVVLIVLGIVMLVLAWVGVVVLQTGPPR